MADSTAAPPDNDHNNNSSSNKDKRSEKKDWDDDDNDNNDVKYLTDDEINTFLDDLDHNNDGLIDYSEIEQKLDKVHGEIAPQALHLRHHDGDGDGRHRREDEARHVFLRSLIRSDKNRIPRQEFFATVRSWKVPSMQQDQANADAQNEYMRRLGLPRRVRSYLAVHGPELGFLALVVAMQVAFGTWQLVKYLTGEHYTAAFGWGVVLAKTCAGALYPTFFFLVLSMSRYFATFLRRWYHVSRFVNWDVSQSFHIRMSVAALALATLHAVGHLGGSFVWGSRKENEHSVGILLGQDKIPRPYTEYVRSLPGFTGITALGLFWLLAALSMPPVRRWSYEIFQLGHLLMFPIIGLLMAHGTAGLLQWPMFGYWLAFPTLLVVVERTVRLLCGFHGIKATLQVLDEETVSVKAKIPSERIWKYRAGQYVFLQVPRISRFQWHPFTVSTCIGTELTLHIKTDGGWTSELRKLGTGGRDPTDIIIGINGPFGAPAQRFNDFHHSIIVGAGIGVTPFSGILADLQERDDQEHNGPTLAETFSREDKAASTMTHGKAQALSTINYAPDYRRVDFHWMVRDKNSLLWLSDLLNRVSHSQHWHAEHDVDSAERHLDIRIHTHVTQKRKEITSHVYRWLVEMHRTPEHPASPLTGLLNKTQFGRPDFVRILDNHYDEMKAFKAASVKGEDQDDEFKVGVFFCGTPVIGEVLADRCRLLSARGREDGSKIEYHFMMEVF